jgi:hypothetical protein
MTSSPAALFKRSTADWANSGSAITDAFRIPTPRYAQMTKAAMPPKTPT